MAPLLEVRGLKKYYRLRGGAGWVRAVDDVSFYIDSGETLGLVGESGCGKTTIGRVILRLLEPTGGEVLFRITENRVERTYPLFHLAAAQIRPLRRHVQMIFQDPIGSLNPRLSIGATLEEGLLVHGLGDRGERRRRIGQLLEQVGLDASAAARYPHAFSGGQRQRIGIARALAVEPSLVVCDEPVSALDVSVQAQILNLLLDLQRGQRLAYLFIAHDLAVVAHMSQRVAVMYRGQIVELGPSAELCRQPVHPYTRALLAAIPNARAEAAAKPNCRTPIGAGAEMTAGGCRYRSRCPEALPQCADVEPPLIQIGARHQVRCHLCKDVNET
jgi:peptide/nickel transport system ATP-binding protein/oligopeptide transport system ATP-binding protein